MKRNNVKRQEATQHNPRKQTILKPTLIALTIMHSLSGQAATIHVGGSLGKGCGLSAAILSANQDVSHPGSRCVAGDGNDTIELHRDITIRKSWKTDDNGVKVDTFTGMPLIDSNITINGNNHTIRRDSTAPEFRLLRSGYGSTLSLNDLKLNNGMPSEQENGPSSQRGGGIFASGDLMIKNSHFSDNRNTVYGDRYANIQVIDSKFINNAGVSLLHSTYNRYSLYVKNSQFKNNDGRVTIEASTSSNYGAAPNTTIIDSIISNNSGTGLILSRSSDVRIDNTVISDNSGTGLIISDSSDVRIDDTIISDNSGRGVDITSSIGSIKNSTISENVDTDCAGIAIRANGFQEGSYPSFISISDSSISNNTATESFGGGVCSLSDGGIYDWAPSNTTIINSALTGNSANTNGGGIFASTRPGLYVETLPASTTLINTTVSANQANGSGGGIYLDGKTNEDRGYLSRDARLTLINSTVVDNSAALSVGGIEAKAAYLDITNSIIAGNVSIGSGIELSAYTSPTFNGPPAIERSENNLFGNFELSNFQAFSGFTPSKSDLTATSDGSTPTQLDSIIQPLADNGGISLTHALTAGSPAINAASGSVCNEALVNSVDQRGEARDDARCDIGAYEFENNASGLPSISVADVSVIESDNKALVRFSLSEPQTSRVKVDYQTIDGTANDGLDYVGRAGSMTFAPGQTQKVRVINLANDDVIEGPESFNLMLSNPVGAELANSIVEISVIDDDGAPTINVEPMSVSVSEGAGFASFRITLSAPQDTKVSVNYQTEIESALFRSDFERRFGSMTFAVGQTTKIRRVEIVQDDVPEANETFRFSLNSPTGAQLGNDTAIGIIIDDD